MCITCSIEWVGLVEFLTLNTWRALLSEPSTMECLHESGHRIGWRASTSIKPRNAMGVPHPWGGPVSRPPQSACQDLSLDRLMLLHQGNFPTAVRTEKGHLICVPRFNRRLWNSSCSFCCADRGIAKINQGIARLVWLSLASVEIGSGRNELGDGVLWAWESGRCLVWVLWEIFSDLFLD